MAARKGKDHHFYGRTDSPIYAYWKGKTGAAHNLSRPVMTPVGPFGSMNEACRSTGVKLETARRRTARGTQGYGTGWYWL